MESRKHYASPTIQNRRCHRRCALSSSTEWSQVVLEIKKKIEFETHLNKSHLAPTYGERMRLTSIFIEETIAVSQTWKLIGHNTRSDRSHQSPFNSPFTQQANEQVDIIDAFIQQLKFLDHLINIISFKPIHTKTVRFYLPPGGLCQEDRRNPWPVWCHKLRDRSCIHQCHGHGLARGLPKSSPSPSFGKVIWTNIDEPGRRWFK